MGTPLEIYKERRVVMVRWMRAKTGDPDALFPEVDVRGTRAEDAYGPIVGIMQGHNATVGLARELIDLAADLYVDVHPGGESNVSIVSPADGHLPATATMNITLSGLAGGNPNDATIEVRFGSLTGPVISTLLVRCYTQLFVAITPHIVTINDAAGAGGTPSVADVASIMAQVQAIWRPCGVSFTIGATRTETVNLATANVMSDTPFPGEIATLLSTNSVPNTINAYFVRQIGTGNTLGYGFSRPSSVTFGTGNPGIILADQAGGAAHDTPWAGNDLAHECGHFFRLWHPNNRQPPHEREDTWSRLNLMHNFNTQPIQGNWQDDNGYGALGGSARRGALITHKHIPHITTDSECTTARAAINAGPF
jgi:hypothetical protein